MILIQFLISMTATFCFAVLFAAPKKELILCGITGAVGWVVYVLCQGLDTGTTIANLIATLALTVLARTIAAIRKNPVTIYLISGIFTLVPGAGIYYTSYYFIMNDTVQSSGYGMDTVKVAGAIVLGIIFGFALPQSWFNTLFTPHNSQTKESP